MRGPIALILIAWVLTLISAVIFAVELDDANKRIASLMASRMYWGERASTLELILRMIDQAKSVPVPIGDKVAEIN